jgi:hypothetical protein
MYKRKRTKKGICSKYDNEINIKRLNMTQMKKYSFCLDPCARVNCNYGRCEVDRTRAVCRCYQGYTGHECSTPLGEFNMCSLLGGFFSS